MKNQHLLLFHLYNFRDKTAGVVYELIPKEKIKNDPRITLSNGIPYEHIHIGYFDHDHINQIGTIERKYKSERQILSYINQHFVKTGLSAKVKSWKIFAHKKVEK